MERFTDVTILIPSYGDFLNEMHIKCIVNRGETITIYKKVSHENDSDRVQKMREIIGVVFCPLKLQFSYNTLPSDSIVSPIASPSTFAVARSP